MHCFVFQFALCAIVCILVLLLEMYTDTDIAAQDTLYNFSENRWAVTRALHKVWGRFFYTGFKGAVIAFGVGVVLAGSFFKTRLRPFRTSCLKIVLALALAPLCISSLKAVTRMFIYCPASLERYGGSEPYIRICESYPQGRTPSGRCFPAGHASGGFVFLFWLVAFAGPSVVFWDSCAG